jgi:hypothetical protein
LAQIDHHDRRSFEPLPVSKTIILSWRKIAPVTSSFLGGVRIHGQGRLGVETHFPASRQIGWTISVPAPPRFRCRTDDSLKKRARLHGNFDSRSSDNHRRYLDWNGILEAGIDRRRFSSWTQGGVAVLKYALHAGSIGKMPPQRPAADHDLWIVRLVPQRLT